MSSLFSRRNGCALEDGFAVSDMGIEIDVCILYPGTAGGTGQTGKKTGSPDILCREIVEIGLTKSGKNLILE